MGNPFNKSPTLGSARDPLSSFNFIAEKTPKDLDAGVLQDEMLLIYLVWTSKKQYIGCIFFLDLLDLSTCKSFAAWKTAEKEAVHFPSTWETPKKPALAPLALKKDGKEIPMVFPGWAILVATTDAVAAKFSKVSGQVSRTLQTSTWGALTTLGLGRMDGWMDGW